LPDESGDPADGQGQPDVAVRPAEMGKIKGDERSPGFAIANDGVA
jgi:hypothetical protein